LSYTARQFQKHSFEINAFKVFEQEKRLINYFFFIYLNFIINQLSLDHTEDFLPPHKVHFVVVVVLCAANRFSY